MYSICFSNQEVKIMKIELMFIDNIFKFINNNFFYYNDLMIIKETKRIE